MRPVVKQALSPVVKQTLTIITVINLLLMCYAVHSYVTINRLTKENHNLVFENQVVKTDLKSYKDTVQRCENVKKFLNNDLIQFLENAEK